MKCDKNDTIKSDYFFCVYEWRILRWTQSKAICSSLLRDKWKRLKELKKKIAAILSAVSLNSE